MSLLSGRLGAVMPRPTTPPRHLPACSTASRGPALAYAVALACSALTLACSGNDSAASAASPQSAAAPAASAASGAADKAAGQPEKTADAPAKPPTLTATPGAENLGSVPGPVDPKWFRVDLFPGAALVSSGRTARDEAGLFATQMLLALPDGTTREGCVSTLTQALSGVVPQLDLQHGKDGRVTLTGSNDDYAVTLLCGEAKGKLNAYISYRWSRPPPTPVLPGPVSRPLPPAPLVP